MQQPEQLGPFRILRPLGRGGMGAVYQGIHALSGEPVAVKVLLENLDESPDVRKRFEAEIDALKMLRHPNIVRLNGFGQEGTLLYYVMELVCGTTLHKELRNKRGFFWQDVAKIGYDVCLALKHGHDRGITHRDLKPANIMLDHSGVVKIADYGIAHCFGNNRLTGSNSVIGTIEFMAPEQAVAAPVGPKADLYSLGAVLYTLLCRRPPFLAKTLPEIISKHQNDPLEDITRFRQDVPVELTKIIRNLLERKPENRPHNAFLAAKRLEALLESEFGSPDAVIVLPSKPDSASHKTAPETRTIVIAPKNSGEPVQTPANTSEDSPSAADSQSFTVQSDTSIYGGLSSLSKSGSTSNAGKDLKTGDSAPSMKNQDDESDSFRSVYHDLSDLSSVKAERPDQETQQTFAFDHLRKPPDNSQSEESRHEATELSASSFAGSAYLEKIETDAEEVHVNTSDSGLSTIASKDRSAGHQGYSSFTPVYEDELGHYRSDQKSDDRPFISVQVAVLSICLVVLGLWAWYMLQPPSADSLFHQIDRRVNAKPVISRQSAILDSEDNIKKFLALYSDDPRATTVQKYFNEIELARQERNLERQLNALSVDKKLLPVERAYLEAVSVVNVHPERTMEELKNLISLYESPKSLPEKTDPNERLENDHKNADTVPDLSNPTAICVEIAKRRLAVLQRETSSINETQIAQLNVLLDRASRIAPTGPEDARKIRLALIRLYESKPWAKEVVERAKKELEEVKNE
ncbi:MAG: serine/threonine protein kinase [Planctomycetaceae bacterium]|nr:serine/threonine protein kinase [Planctomycetaceae bacterium]